MKKYNWGIIGTGWIAHEMADALQASKGEVYEFVPLLVLSL